MSNKEFKVGIKSLQTFQRSSQFLLLTCSNNSKNLFNQLQNKLQQNPFIKMARIIALIALFACVALAFAAPAEEKKEETLQTANSFGLGYGGLGYGGLYGGGLGYGGLYGGGLYGGGLGYGIGLGHGIGGFGGGLGYGLYGR